MTFEEWKSQYKQPDIRSGQSLDDWLNARMLDAWNAAQPADGALREANECPSVLVEDGVKMLCQLGIGHDGPHENGSWVWNEFAGVERDGKNDALYQLAQSWPHEKELVVPSSLGGFDVRTDDWTAPDLGYQVCTSDCRRCQLERALAAQTPGGRE